LTAGSLFKAGYPGRESHERDSSRLAEQDE